MSPPSSATAIEVHSPINDNAGKESSAVEAQQGDNQTAVANNQSSNVSAPAASTLSAADIDARIEDIVQQRIGVAVKEISEVTTSLPLSTVSIWL